MKGEQHEFNFTIEEWSRNGSRVHAGANNITVARAAYEEQKRQTPDRLIKLKQGARIIERSDERGT